MVVVAAGLLVAGCAEPGADEDYSQVESYATVAGYTTSSCSTAVVLGLSRQIADEVGCANPTGLVKLNAGGNLQITSNAVLPYLSMKGKTDVEAVAQGRIVQINSAFRTVAQQYLLYRWYQLGRCGITAAATPGRSNHESGRALDLANYSAVISAMAARGWAHDVPGDPVHFDHLSSPDIRGRDVLAFQRLWNRNHPEDLIAEDGDYGANTEARLRMAPAEGFPLGPTCLGTRELEVVGVNGPDRVAPTTKVHYAMTLKNSGTATWPATTKLRLATATTSALHDASWTSEAVIATLGAPIAAMSSGTIDFDVMTPAATEELPIAEDLVLDDNGQKFGDIQFALTVVPGGGEGESSEGSEYGDDVQGGCSTGGGSTGALVLLGFVGLARRRRRR
jgi:MYXO-CTERM domain-containing protein